MFVAKFRERGHGGQSSNQTSLAQSRDPEHMSDTSPAKTGGCCVYSMKLRVKPRGGGAPLDGPPMRTPLSVLLQVLQKRTRPKPHGKDGLSDKESANQSPTLSVKVFQGPRISQQSTGRKSPNCPSSSCQSFVAALCSLLSPVLRLVDEPKATRIGLSHLWAWAWIVLFGCQAKCIGAKNQRKRFR